jgi:hypothetical protein
LEERDIVKTGVGTTNIWDGVIGFSDLTKFVHHLGNEVVIKIEGLDLCEIREQGFIRFLKSPVGPDEFTVPLENFGFVCLLV